MQENALMEVREVRKVFGGLAAVDGVSFDVLAGRTHAVIGPNGAGKSTLLDLLSGVQKATSGEVLLEGRTISEMAAHDISSLGLSRTFQNVRLFENMTVLENVMVGMHARTGQGLLPAALRLPSMRREEKRIAAGAMAYLDEVGLADRAGDPAASLPFGRQRLLEMARAMAAEPRLILCDEPASGLSSHEVDGLADLLKLIVARGISVLLVDHDMQFVMGISDVVTVLDHGRKIAEGTSAEVQEHRQVIEAYLGGEG